MRHIYLDISFDTPLPVSVSLWQKAIRKFNEVEENAKVITIEKIKENILRFTLEHENI